MKGENDNSFQCQVPLRTLARVNGTGTCDGTRLWMRILPRATLRIGSFYYLAFDNYICTKHVQVPFKYF